ncbi:TonB-dependent receptor [Steroidobacter agaridevorans]|uniref:TonB-dependent receptor n=1 Tax=Steroidobacter agaridevorans TaxID=2695856 RepID=A0A829Y5E5_9GAMM|nr:TonB-dependent siderophore receptor [Steroidobacter agaridevorans]GFE78427.1 TonB-dependent receptor [Steroidobacter agaridevorans]
MLAVRRSLLLSSLAIPALIAAQNVAAQEATSSKADDDIIDYVIVTGSQVSLPPEYAGGQVARGGRVGLFGNLDVMDTPFNSTNFTAEFMRNLQARSVADVVQSDPGVRVARGFGNFQELYVVRGFPVYSDDMGYNGLYGLLPRQYVAAEFLERVEVFRGANSFLNGAAPNGSGVGGSFNLVPKRAPDADLNRMTLGYENDGQAYAAADFGRRFGGDDSFGLRANAVRRDGEMSIEDQERQLTMFSLGVDYRGEKARFSADFGWQDHNIDAPRPSVTPSLTAIPRAPDSSKNYAQDWTFSSEKDFFGVARGEYDISDNIDVWAAVGIRDSEEHNALANPTFSPTAAAPDRITTYLFENYREDLVLTGDTGIRFEFDTGPVGHRVSVSGSYFDLDSKNAYVMALPADRIVTDLRNPVQAARPDGTFFGGVLSDPRTTTETTTKSIAAADTLAFADERVLVTLGARYQIIEQHTFNYNTGAENCVTPRPGATPVCGYDENVVTPIGAVVFKIADQFSLYANYAEGLLQGTQVPTTVSTPSGVVTPVNGGQTLDPFVSTQYEIGAKYDGGSIGATLSMFRVNMPTAILAGDVVRDDGEQLNRGIEFSAYGQAAESLRLLGGVTYLDAEYRKTEFGRNEGNTVIGVPEIQANVGLELDVARGLSVDGRVVYTSSQEANLTNTLSIPSWTRLDLGARYELQLGETRTLTFRARLDNVTDKNYWASVGGSAGSNYLVLGSPRTFVLSASLDF